MPCLQQVGTSFLGDEDTVNSDRRGCYGRNMCVLSVIWNLEFGVEVNVQYHHCSERQPASDSTMSLVEFCENGDLEEVTAALKNGADVNSKRGNDWTGLMRAVYNHHNSVVELLLKTPNIDVNLKSINGSCALRCAVTGKNNVGLKLLLNVPNIDVNSVDNFGESALHRAMEYKSNIEGLKLLLSHPSIDVNIVDNDGESALLQAVLEDNIEALKFLLSHPSLTAVTLNQKEVRYGDTPVMRAVRWNRLEHLALLAADPRVDLDTTDEGGRSLEEVARWVLTALAALHFIPVSRSVGPSVLVSN